MWPVCWSCVADCRLQLEVVEGAVAGSQLVVQCRRKLRPHVYVDGLTVIKPCTGSIVTCALACGYHLKPLQKSRQLCASKTTALGACKRMVHSSCSKSCRVYPLLQFVHAPDCAQQVFLNLPTQQPTPAWRHLLGSTQQLAWQVEHLATRIQISTRLHQRPACSQLRRQTPQTPSPPPRAHPSPAPDNFPN